MSWSEWLVTKFAGVVTLEGLLLERESGYRDTGSVAKLSISTRRSSIDLQSVYSNQMRRLPLVSGYLAN